MQKLITIAICLFAILPELKSQLNLSDSANQISTKINSRNSKRKFIQILWIDTIPKGVDFKGFIIRQVCKNNEIQFPIFYSDEKVSDEKIATANPFPKNEHIPLLKVTGNILYDINYRSRIDTPYAENNIYQHTMQTRLDFLYKNQYPFRIYLTAHFSNSPLFRKYTDFNFHYSQSDFLRLIKNKIINATESFMASRTWPLDSLKRLIDLKRIAISSLNHSIHKPDIFQKLVEEKERELFTTKTTANSISDKNWEYTEIQNPFSWQEKYKFPQQFTSEEGVRKNNSTKDLDKFYAYKDSIGNDRRKLDSLITELGYLEKLYKNAATIQQFKKYEWRKKIEDSKDANELAQTLHQLNMPDTILPKGYKLLCSIKSLGIGRSMANYSELSVKNISITGLQVEYNPNYYYVFAAGRVDYRFRDYIIPVQQRSNQYVALMRFGKGMRNGNHIIFTYYTGKRQFFNASIASQLNTRVPEYNLAGISVEGFYKISRTTSLIAEVAKSTIPFYSLDSLQKKNWMNTVANFKDKSNEAYSIQFNSYLPKTQTRLSGNLKYIGANFQSFSTFTSGASQLRWMIKAEQPFFKKKLNIISSLQQNDYSNPFVTTAYQSSSILASFQASLRIKQSLAFSAGYYPSYQLTKVSNNYYSETRYYTMIANASYYYHVNSAQLSSYVVFSRFYNQATDSGFVYFNSKNLLLSQNITIGPLSMLLNLSESLNTDYKIYTIENTEQFAINRIISIGSGVKMIRHTLFNNIQWGYSGNLTLRIPKLGDVQFMMDKGFIPGLNKQLVENKMGRLTYFKTF